jgi:hypothetical protein
MWVWRKLGFDNVNELPSTALETIGRRCRAADGVASEEAGPYDERLRDTQGAFLEFCDTKRNSHLFSSTQSELKGPSQPWQLVEVGSKTNKTICMPGSMDLVIKESDPECPKASLIDNATGSELQGTVKDALEMFVKRAETEGVCSFTWRVPRALAQLSPMAQAECCDSIPGPSAWPLTVVGAVVGAELHFTVSIGLTIRFVGAFARDDFDNFDTFERELQTGLEELGAKQLGDLTMELHPGGVVSFSGPRSALQELKNLPIKQDLNRVAEEGKLKLLLDHRVAEVSVSDKAAMAALSNGDGSLDNALAAQAALTQEHYVECKGFRLHIVQRGGPPLDPSKWHGLHEEDVASEAERWSRLIIKRPSMWRVIYVKTYESKNNASDVTEGRGNIIEQPVLGRKPDDVVLAATATAELLLEPFELNYGDQHIKAIRRMLEEEVGSILKLKSSQVLCGDLFRKGQGGRQKHLRRDTIGFRIAILHEELANSRDDAAKVPFGTLRRHDRQTNIPDNKKVGVLPPIGVSEGQAVLTRLQIQKLDEAQKNVTQTTTNGKVMALKMTMEAAAMAAEIEVINSNVQQARMGKKPKYKPMTQAEDAMTSLQSADYSKHDKTLPVAAMRRASSAPELLGASQTSPVKKSMMSLSSAGIETRQEFSPDNLLKVLLKALEKDSKHPVHRHLDVFPVLARLVPKSANINSTLVTHPDTMTLGKMAESFKSAISNRKPAAANRKRKFEKDADDVSKEQNSNLTQMRDMVLEVAARPDGELALKREKLGRKSPKELLDMMEASYNLYKDLTLVLDVFLSQTETSEDRSVKLRSHNLIPKMSHVMALFKSDRNIVERTVHIYSNATRHDPGSIESIYENDIAPVILDALKCFPKARTLQMHGCRVLRRLYDLARRKSTQGRRVILLGKSLPEVWTYQGIDHVLLAMEYFREDAEILLETFNMLVPLTETIASHGRSVDVFKAVDRAMNIHRWEQDLLAHGIHTIARLGPVFMSHEHTGIRAIVEAMARHRSCVKVQRVGNKALFALCGQQDSLTSCRKDGAVSAIVSAMHAHNKDQQVLQMGVRCLEKHCPRGLWKLSHICGDLVSILPIVLWRTDPVDHNPPVFNLANLRNEFPDFDDPALLDNFHGDIVESARPPSPPSGERSVASISDKDNLATLTGYRRVGLRDDIDASDKMWAVPGPAAIYPPVKGQHNVLNKAVANLKKLGCDIEPQLVAGPRKNHVKMMVDALKEGLGQMSVPVAAKTTKGGASSPLATKPVKFGSEDAELFAAILGHFAWHSKENANEVVAAGGVGVLLQWLRNTDLVQSLDPAEIETMYPMQRACLAALSSLCRHGADCAGALLTDENKAHQDVLGNVYHHDIGMRRSAMRCLARLLPYSVKRSEKLTPAKVWPVILKQLHDDDEAIRTAAAAAALEAVVADWAKLGRFEEQDKGAKQLEEFINALNSALQRAVQSGAAAAALPVLLTIASLAEDDDALGILSTCNGLQSRLTTWPPRSVEADATGIDRAAAAAAAKALESLCERRIMELSVREQQMLLTCASSDHTIQSPALRDALEGALRVAVAQVEDAGFLAQLLGTPVKAAHGKPKLASIDVLTVVAERLAELLDKVPGKSAGTFSKELATALDHVEPLFHSFSEQCKGEETGGLRTLLQALRSHCGGSSYQGYPSMGESMSHSLPGIEANTPVAADTTTKAATNPRSKIDAMA